MTTTTGERMCKGHNKERLLFRREPCYALLFGLKLWDISLPHQEAGCWRHDLCPRPAEDSSVVQGIEETRGISETLRKPSRTHCTKPGSNISIWTQDVDLPNIPRSCSLPSTQTPCSCPILRWSHEDCLYRTPLGRGTSDHRVREWL